MTVAASQPPAGSAVDPARAAADLLTALAKLPPFTGIVFHGLPVPLSFRPDDRRPPEWEHDEQPA